MAAIIALITDFGTEDGYAGALKGRILTENSALNVVDISHAIEPFNIRQAAYCLANAFTAFPAGTIFVVVVDPGVGTERKGLIIHSGNYIFIGPDNGVFSFVPPPTRVQKIDVKRLPWPVNATFHGRDVFAPLAARLASGADLPDCLKPVEDFRRLFNLQRWLDGDAVDLEVAHIDHFGNVLLNLHQSAVNPSFAPAKWVLFVKDLTVTKFLDTFGDAEKDEILFGWDSSGFLQIAQNRGNAARSLSLRIGDKVRLQR